MRARVADMCAALRRWPGLGDWLRTALELAWALSLMLVVAHAGGLVRLSHPPDAITMIGLGATLLAAPALGEELLFRGLVIPRNRPTWKWIGVSVMLFVAWHPLQAATIGPPWSAMFLDPWFLAVVAILGAALARIYAATRSLWPCVAVHWLVVFCWKVFLGGPF
jgi:predicted Abi (CAAX) family protease